MHVIVHVRVQSHWDSVGCRQHTCTKVSEGRLLHMLIDIIAWSLPPPPPLTGIVVFMIRLLSLCATQRRSGSVMEEETHLAGGCGQVGVVRVVT